MTVILAIANQNSGVGKTVTAANVSAGFARAGRHTLAVDCDAQANLTRWLLGRADEDAADLEAIVAGGADPTAAVHPTRVVGLDALPPPRGWPTSPGPWPPTAPASPWALGRLRPRYDAMVLDLPSSLGRLTISALAAADGIVIPVTASPLGLQGWPASATGWPASAPTAASPRRCGACSSPRPTWTPRGGCGPGWAATCGTPSPTSGSPGAAAAGAGAPPGRRGRPGVPAAAAGRPGGPCRAGPRRDRRLRPAGRLPAGAGARSPGRPRGTPAAQGMPYGWMPRTCEPGRSCAPRLPGSPTSPCRWLCYRVRQRRRGGRRRDGISPDAGCAVAHGVVGVAVVLEFLVPVGSR